MSISWIIEPFEKLQLCFLNQQWLAIAGHLFNITIFNIIFMLPQADLKRSLGLAYRHFFHTCKIPCECDNNVEIEVRAQTDEPKHFSTMLESKVGRYLLHGGFTSIYHGFYHLLKTFIFLQFLPFLSKKKKNAFINFSFFSQKMHDLLFTIIELMNSKAIIISK